MKLRGGSCRAYWSLCQRLEPARRAYRLIAEESLGLDARRELEAAELGAVLQEPARTCEFAHWLLGATNTRVACIIGPLAERVPKCPGLVMSVEQVAGLAPRLDIVAGDLDALLSPSVPLSTARFWLVHLHGDNLPLSRLLADQTYGSIVYTSQRYCLWPVLGIGGFTDGDRLVSLAMALGFKEIRLIGFNLDEPQCIGKTYCDLKAKKAKLNVASSIIGYLARYYGYVYRKNRVLIKDSFM